MLKKSILPMFLLVLVTGCGKEQEQWPVIKGETMGTYYSVTYNPDNTRVVWKRLQDQIDSLLEEVNHTMSTYIDDSELSLLNQVNIQMPVVISEELFFVINAANQVSEQSDGAFDATVGPLVNLWGFGPNPLQRNVPTDDEIRFVMQYVGYNKLLLEPKTFSVTKTEPMMYIDLSGIAKGYGVDLIAEHMDSLNITDYLVDIGGELIGKGKNREGKPWQIGIEQPKTLAREVQRIIELDNMAMATSGDYRNYFKKDGIRYSHTINPVTGKPVTHDLASVTVLHEDCMQADAWATAFQVMGPEKSLELANSLKLAVFMIIKDGDTFLERYNERFSQYLGQ